ncbi:hypothetical protein [Corynebacterium sp. 321]|uniref:hypothetical protein n=1 Tax=Corynebacterium sp. 321 TaxID=2651047 RepID=UPI0013016BFE|nr:hypothetical protein [Corynebacterium sp. 321]KAB1551439.1 hypothetical protein F7233_08015 [Corynebacterium sp. 321]
MIEKILVLSCGFLLLIAALCFGFAGNNLVASVCSLIGILVFWYWRWSPPSTKPGTNSASDNPSAQDVRHYRQDHPGTNSASDNPSAQDVRHYRQDHPGTSILQAVQELKRR